MDLLPQFIAAVFVLMIIPGPDMVLCIASGISHGAKGALFAAVGIGVGGLLLTVTTTFIVFLSNDFHSNAFAFLQIFGSLYLLYLGITILIGSDGASTPTRSTRQPAHHHLFLRGIITNISNPKALVFFISFIPQFIPTNTPSPHSSALILGVTLCVIVTPINFLFGLSGISIQPFAAKKIRGRTIADWVTALIFISIAIIFLGNYIFM